MYPLLFEAGFASRPVSQGPGDGFELQDLYVTNAVKCLPPGNLPTSGEFATCRPYLEEELGSLPRLQIVLALGQAAFLSYLRLLRQQGEVMRLADTPFAHGHVYRFSRGPLLVASYHTSRYNIQTGRLTREMFLGLLHDVRTRLDGEIG